MDSSGSNPVLCYNLELLTSTPSSDIYLATHKENGDEIVVKQILKKDNVRNMEIAREKKYMELAKNSNNPNLVRTIDSWEDSINVYLLLEYYPDGTLKQFLEKHPENRLPEDKAIEIFGKILKGYSWLRENNLVHRDLKTENVFMKGEEPILSDLGCARALQEELKLTTNPMEMSHKYFSISNRSPEQIRDRPYGFEVDIWGLGLILYEMIYGVHPFEAETQMKTERNICYLKFQEKVQLEVSPDCKALIHAMLETQEKRIKWEDLIVHKALKTKIAYKEDDSPTKMKKKITILSVIKEEEREYKTSETDRTQQKEIRKLFGIAHLLNKTFLVINNCQKKIAQTYQGKNLFDYAIFLSLVCGLTKIAIMKLRLAFYQVNTDSQIRAGIESEVKTADELKRKLEDFLYGDLTDLINSTKYLTFFDKSLLENILLTALKNQIYEDEKYEAQFRYWLETRRPDLINKICEYFNDLASDGKELLILIGDVLNVLIRDEKYANYNALIIQNVSKLLKKASFVDSPVAASPVQRYSVDAKTFFNNSGFRDVSKPLRKFPSSDNPGAESPVQRYSVGQKVLANHGDSPALANTMIMSKSEVISRKSKVKITEVDGVKCDDGDL